MPDRPARPGKHAARHKGPSSFARATDRIIAAGSARGLRRTGGTVIALGAVVLAGAAGNGAATGAGDDDNAAASARTLHRPSPQDVMAAAKAQGAREAQAADASRGQARQARADLRQAERRDHMVEVAKAGASQADANTAQAESLVPEDPREIAQSMLADYGWDSSEYECLDELWISESNWDPSAENPSSGAYGIPQSLPPEKMATAGADWATNPATQIEWGLGYIEDSYGTPCSAWEFKQANNWY